MSSKEIIVSISIKHDVVRVGRLWLHTRGLKTSASFEYDKAWLAHPLKFELDPSLKLGSGVLHTQRSVFPAIEDCMPDRWGRILMRRAAALQSASTKPRTLVERDYLLMVSDELRMGALRFSEPNNEDLFLSESKTSVLPPLVRLPQLLSATQTFLNNNEGAEDLQLLLQPGSSLGGARPKACVAMPDGNIALAKFSKPDDEYNVVAWEAVALCLAEKAGLQVPKWELKKISNTDVLIVQRFDRQGAVSRGHQQWRIPFLSAMSLLGARDNETRSYIEIAYALLKHGAQPDRDLHELWRRIVLSVMISNTDDHLRNHGFLYEWARGWRLSPVYDINPRPVGIKNRYLSTAIDFNNTQASLELALSVAVEFRLSQQQAKDIISEVSKAVKLWPQVATQLGLKKECQLMREAFQIVV